MNLATSENPLLNLIDPLHLLGGNTEQVRAGQVLPIPGVGAVDAFFPISAALSVISTMSNGDSCEIALVGREGMLGPSGALNSFDDSTSCVVQVGGTCVRLAARSVNAARQCDSLVLESLDGYVAASLRQVARLAACNRLHPLGSRLARWLSMLRDRIDRDHFRLTQQSIANSLGVHRPTIAQELQRLHAAGAIRYRGRIIQIADRVQLEKQACECLQPMRREYFRMFLIRRPSVS